MEQYIDFAVTPYALPDACEALYNNGITDAVITKEDGMLHVRWKYDPCRNAPKKKHGIFADEVQPMLT